MSSSNGKCRWQLHGMAACFFGGMRACDNRAWIFHVASKVRALEMQLQYRMFLTSRTHSPPRASKVVWNIVFARILNKEDVLAIGEMVKCAISTRRLRGAFA